MDQHQEKINKRLKVLEDEKTENLLALKEGRLQDIPSRCTWMINDHWESLLSLHSKTKGTGAWVTGSRRNEYVQENFVGPIFVLEKTQALQKNWIGYNNEPVVWVKEVTKDDFIESQENLKSLVGIANSMFAQTVTIGKHKGVVVRPRMYVFTSPSFFSEFYALPWYMYHPDKPILIKEIHSDENGTILG